MRYDPFDLLFRRLSFEGELALGPLPLTIELSPSWIFDSPSEGFDENGFAIGAALAWYVKGDALEGMWVKAHVEYEHFTAIMSRDVSGAIIGKPDATLCDADSATGTCKRPVGSAIVGLLLGNSMVFGGEGGFAITGGIGIGVALAEPAELRVDACSAQDVVDGNVHCSEAEPVGSAGIRQLYYDKAGRIRLLGSLSLGVTF